MNISKLKNLFIERTFIEDVIYFEQITSTNEFCKKEKGKDNLLVIAGFQTEGRGRFERTWESEPDKNLLYSIKKKIPRNSKNYFSVNFYFTYFLLDSIVNHLALNKYDFNKNLFEIKWPNDLLYKRNKISGLLIESVFNKNEFIIGTGINVNQEKFSPSLDNITTSLKKITGKEINLEKLLSDIIYGLSENFALLREEKDREIYELWKSKFKMAGENVRYLNNESKEEIAQVIDINEDGSIKILKNGEISNHFSGEIKLRTN
ncbi:MAG: biotin--[acetyl-CoA-carboxylase] ligase [Ignavibacteria bacterium]